MLMVIEGETAPEPGSSVSDPADDEGDAVPESTGEGPSTVMLCWGGKLRPKGEGRSCRGGSNRGFFLLLLDLLVLRCNELRDLLKILASEHVGGLSLVFAVTFRWFGCETSHVVDLTLRVRGALGEEYRVTHPFAVPADDSGLDMIFGEHRNLLDVVEVGASNSQTSAIHEKTVVVGHDIFETRTVPILSDNSQFHVLFGRPK